MNTLELAHREVSAALERQEKEDEAFDAKAGLIFAYNGALSVASLSLGHEGEFSTSSFLLGLLFAAEGALLSLGALWPVRLNVPPEPHLFALFYGVRPAQPASELFEDLIGEQVDALDVNELLLRKKLRFVVGAAVFSVAALISFALQAVSRASR